MVKQRHEHQADATTNAAEGRGSTARCSSQQAAAAWAWFEHGGSTCITPSKAQGLIAAKRNAKFNLARTSRFKKEVLSSTVIPHHSPPGCSDDGPAIFANGHARRCHSFHDDDLAKPTNSYTWRFRASSCRWTLTSPHFSIDEGPEYQDHEDEDLEVAHQISSDLLDKFEVDAVCRQLHDHLRRSGMSSGAPSFTCNTETPEYYEAQKAHRDHHLQAHIKPRRYFKSSHALKPSADNDHHQNIIDLVHWILRLRKISTSSRSISTAPALCSSIATADSIIDHRNRHHHHPASPEGFRAVAPINQTSKRQQTLHDRSKSRQSTGRHSNHSGEMKRNQISETAYERAEFASSPRKSQQKMPSRSSELEIIRGAHPGRLHHSDSIHSELLQPLMSLLHGAPSTEDDVGVLKARTYFHKHHHIYHHHHYHHLHHANHHQASKDGVLLHHGGAHAVQHPPKLHSFLEEEHMMPPASRVQYSIGSAM